MNIGFIGFGMVARTMESYFIQFNDINIIGHTTSKSNEFLPYIITQSDIIFISTSDDSIKFIAKEISKDYSSVDLNNKTFCIFSGAIDSLALKPLADLGAKTVSLHPPMTFSNIIEAKNSLKNISFALEGSYSQKLEELLLYTNLKYFKIAAKDKPVYHAALTMASNYLVTLLDSSVNLLQSIGIDEYDAVNILKPLTETTLKNCLTNLPRSSLTGPISRGDADTIRLHLDNINESFKNIYIQMGLETLNLANIENEKKNHIKEVLQNG